MKTIRSLGLRFSNMNVGDAEEVVSVLDSCLASIKWRMRASAKRRLQIDILALCTGMRSVVMVDYGGKLPELRDHLCMLIQHAHKELAVLESLRVMIVEDMIYMIHVHGLCRYVASWYPEFQPKFVDLEQNPLKILEETDQNALADEFVLIQKLFSSVFQLVEVKAYTVPLFLPPVSKETKAESSECTIVQSSGAIDLTHCLRDTNVPTPTLNGWLLGYPVVYLFGKDHVEEAIGNLSTKSLHLYKIVVSRMFDKKTCEEEELMSFSVPYDLSREGKDEPWAKAFFTHMMEKFSKSKHTWSNLRLEVSSCYPQAIAL